MIEKERERELLHKQVRLGGLEGSLELSGGRSNLPEDQRELDLTVMKLLSALSLAEVSWDCSCLDNLNAREPDSVS